MWIIPYRGNLLCNYEWIDHTLASKISKFTILLSAAMLASISCENVADFHDEGNLRESYGSNDGFLNRGMERLSK
jgi:hypothetical protein